MCGESRCVCVQLRSQLLWIELKLSPETRSTGGFQALGSDRQCWLMIPTRASPNLNCRQELDGGSGTRHWPTEAASSNTSRKWSALNCGFPDSRSPMPLQSVVRSLGCTQHHFVQGAVLVASRVARPFRLSQCLSFVCLLDSGWCTTRCIGEGDEGGN